MNIKVTKMFIFRVKIHFVDRNGIMMSVVADVGENMLDVAKDYDIDGVEGL